MSCARTQFVIDPGGAVDAWDENTIGIVAILGIPYIPVGRKT